MSGRFQSPPAGSRGSTPTGVGRYAAGSPSPGPALNSSGYYSVDAGVKRYGYARQVEREASASEFPSVFSTSSLYASADSPTRTAPSPTPLVIDSRPKTPLPELCDSPHFGRNSRTNSPELLRESSGSNAVVLTDIPRPPGRQIDISRFRISRESPSREQLARPYTSQSQHPAPSTRGFGPAVDWSKPGSPTQSAFGPSSPTNASVSFEAQATVQDRLRASAPSAPPGYARPAADNDPRPSTSHTQQQPRPTTSAGQWKEYQNNYIIQPGLRPSIVLQGLHWRKYKHVDQTTGAVQFDTNGLELDALLWGNLKGQGAANWRMAELERMLAAAQEALQKLRADSVADKEDMKRRIAEMEALVEREQLGITAAMYARDQTLAGFKDMEAYWKSCEELERLVNELQEEHGAAWRALQPVLAQISSIENDIAMMRKKRKELDMDAIRLKVATEKVLTKRMVVMHKDVERAMRVNLIDFWLGDKCYALMLNDVCESLCRHLGQDWCCYIIQDRNFKYPIPRAKRRRHQWGDPFPDPKYPLQPWMRVDLQYTAASLSQRFLVGCNVPHGQGASRAAWSPSPPHYVIVNNVLQPNTKANLVYYKGLDMNGHTPQIDFQDLTAVVPIYRFKQTTRAVSRLSIYNPNMLKNAVTTEDIDQLMKQQLYGKNLNKGITDLQAKNQAASWSRESRDAKKDLKSPRRKESARRKATATSRRLDVGDGFLEQARKDMAPKRGAFMAAPILLEGHAAAVLCVDSMQREPILPALTAVRVKAIRTVADAIGQVFTKVPVDYAQQRLDEIERKRQELLDLINRIQAQLNTAASRALMAEMIGYANSPGKLVEMFVIIMLLVDFPNLPFPNGKPGPCPVLQYVRALPLDDYESRQESWDVIKQFLTVSDTETRSKGLISILDLMRDAPLEDRKATGFVFRNVKFHADKMIGDFPRTAATKMSKCAELLWDWVHARGLLADMQEEFRLVELEIAELRALLRRGRPVDTFHEDLRKLMGQHFADERKFKRNHPHAYKYLYRSSLKTGEAHLNSKRKSIILATSLMRVTQEEHEAATKIQALQRGKMARRKLNDTKTPEPDLTAEQKELIVMREMLGSRGGQRTVFTVRTKKQRKKAPKLKRSSTTMAICTNGFLPYLQTKRRLSKRTKRSPSVTPPRSRSRTPPPPTRTPVATPGRTPVATPMRTPPQRSPRVAGP